ncbi:MAG: DNA alkylation repair enzyme, partial [Alistipes sp.]|nr:DNA alkylation repair enzyme [Alistipes sp.]
VEAVRRAAECASGTAAEPVAEPASGPVAASLSAPLAARLTAQGAVALLAAVGARNEENRQAVLRAVGSLGKLPAEDYVHEELTWRLEA